MTFRERVYLVVSKIPQGSVLSYKEVAHRSGNPKAHRAVGNILNKNNNPQVPCHRVIRSDGTVGGFRDGAQAKIVKLNHEGFFK